MNKITSLEAFKIKKLEQSCQQRCFLIRITDESKFCYAHMTLSQEDVMELKDKIDLWFELSESNSDLSYMCFKFYNARLTSVSGKDEYRDDVLRFINESSVDVVAELPSNWDSPSVVPMMGCDLFVDAMGFVLVFGEQQVGTERVPTAFVRELIREIKEGGWGGSTREEIAE